MEQTSADESWDCVRNTLSRGDLPPGKSYGSFCARALSAQLFGRCSNPRLRFFISPQNRLSYQSMLLCRVMVQARKEPMPCDNELPLIP